MCALELKIVSGKVYLQRDFASWEGNLLCQFSKVLLSQKTSEHVKFLRDPINVDDILDEEVKYLETHQSGQMTKDGKT